MGKKILTFGDIEIGKEKFSEDVNINNALVSNKIFSGEKTINTLLVTCMMIIKCSNCI